MSAKAWFPCLLSAFAALLFGAGEAQACSCGRTPSVLREYEWADAVVIARADAVEKARPGEESGSGGIRSTTLTVEKVYKGNFKPGDPFTLEQGGGGNCIWTFREEDVGRSYLFYLKAFGEEPAWLVGGCGRSGGVERVGDDLLYLNNLGKARGRTRLSGTVRFEAAGAPGLAGRKIRVVGAGRTFELLTDEQGVYELYDLPAGRYTVVPEVPRGWRVNGYLLEYSPSYAGDSEAGSPKSIPVVVEARKHAGLDIHFEIVNAVAGKVFDPAGGPMEGVCLALLPAEGKRPEHPFGRDCTEADGSFRMDEISPGSYVIVVNDDGKVTSSEPFGTFFYPNAPTREGATVLTVGAGDFVENLQIHVPRVEETVTVEGVFLYSDGKPVVGESVAFRSEQTGDGDDDDDADAEAGTDAKGRFSVKVLRGARGRLRGEMLTYSGEYENCSKLESLIRQSGVSVPTVKTPPVEIRADVNVYGVELRYPFPGCKKAK